MFPKYQRDRVDFSLVELLAVTNNCRTFVIPRAAWKRSGQWSDIRMLRNSPTNSKSVPSFPWRSTPNARVFSRTIPRSPQSTAFSLIELLVVISVIALLMALIVPAVGSFGRSTGLVSGGNLAVNLVSLARQKAITKSTMTALVLLGQQGTEDDYRTFTVYEHSSEYGWLPITGWQALPAGIIVDRRAGAEDSERADGSFFAHSPKSLPEVGEVSATPILHQGRIVRDFAARIFLPTGGLQNADQPAQIRLVEGFLDGEKIAYTRRGDAGQPANYYDVTIIGATGFTKVDRP